MIEQADTAAQEVAGDLLSRFFAEEGFTTSPEAQRRGLAEMLADRAHCVVFLAWLRAESAGGDGEPRDAGVVAREAVGIATASWSHGIEYTRSAEMGDLYVVPAERGRGVASTLVDEVVCWSRAQGCRTLLVTVTPDGELSHGLTGFYVRKGFTDEYRKLLALDLEAS